MPALGATSWTRPIVSNSNKSITPNSAIAAAGNAFIVDVYATVNTASKVLMRVKIPVEFQGTQFRLGSQFLLFPGSAADYSAGGVTPADAAAVKTSGINYSPYLDLNAFYSAAGDNA